jgi:acyl-homoserine-lactone acylase
MNKLKTIFFLFLTVILATSYVGIAQTALSKWEMHAQNVEILRDQWGIPHIYGKTDADAVFGLIYAQCEDDFNRVESNYINALGRMAEVEGKEFLYNDLRMRLFIDESTLKQEYLLSPEWLQKLMSAWADGINYFLASHPEVKPKLIHTFEPWMALAFSEGSIGGDIETISTQQLKRFYDKSTLSSLIVKERDWEEEPRGSNGFAIAPSKSANGHALLLINPHTSFYFRPEVHVVSQEGLNAYGAVTWGQFFVYQGFSEFNGWMHTSSKADAIDHYELTIKQMDGKPFYLFDGNWLPLLEKEIHLKFKSQWGIANENFKVYFSHHGPVIREENGKWIAIALMVEREKALTQSYLRTKTRNHQEFKAVMDLRTNSSNNTVYADKDGNIVYYHGNFVPKRNPNFDWRNTVDGSTSASNWNGLHSVEELIYIHNPINGWLQNCNSTPFTAAGSYSPKVSNYPSYMSWDTENARGINAVRVLRDIRNFNLDSLIKAAYEPSLLAFEPLIPQLLQAFQNLPQASPNRNALKEAVEVLGQWDLKTSTTSIATSLAVFWGQELLDLEVVKNRPWDAYVFNYIAQEVSEEDLLQSLNKAMNRIEIDFGKWKTTWGEINRFQRLTGEINGRFDDQMPSLPVPYNSSLWGSLAAYGSRPYANTKKWYGNVGNSFVAVVEFGPKVKAKSLLAGGQSGNPSSPHFNDQAEKYVKGEFKDVYYYRSDVEKHAKIKYQPGESWK